MAKLTSAKRNALPKSTFGLPGQRKYPMPDKNHARNAKARASQQLNRGGISSSQKAAIDRKADRILKEKKLTGKHPADGGEGKRGPEGRGHKQPGLGTHRGSERIGSHRNVVHRESHGEKLLHD